MPDDDRLEEIFRTALSRKAEAAPTRQGLAGQVRARLARRRRRRVAGATLACVAVIAGVLAIVQGNGSDIDDGRPDVVQRPDGPKTERIDKPDNWRWESYGGVELAVPRWDYGTTGQPPCLGTWGPYVGRPGFVESVGCPDPIPALGRRRPYLWFDSPEPDGVRTYDHGWVTETRTLGGVPITVLDDDAEERRQIFATAHVVDSVDIHGCPIDHPISDDPTLRPEPVDGGLETVGIVWSTSTCRYRLTDASSSSSPMPHPLIAADRDRSRGAYLHTIRSAPEGSGPNSPEHCLPEVAYGDEAVVLILHGERHDQEVFVRYAGCDGHGIDDGTTQRELTGDMLWNLTTATRTPHRLMEITDPSVAALLRPYVLF